MPAISLPLAQSKASRRSVRLCVTGRVSWLPSFFCDQSPIRQPSGPQLQGCLYGRGSSAFASMTILQVIPTSRSAPQLSIQYDTSTHCLEIRSRATAFSRDQEGEVPLWL
jgi:hypothetical protein